MAMTICQALLTLLYVVFICQDVNASRTIHLESIKMRPISRTTLFMEGTNIFDINEWLSKIHSARKGVFALISSKREVLYVGSSNQLHSTINSALNLLPKNTFTYLKIKSFDNQSNEEMKKEEQLWLTQSPSLPIGNRADDPIFKSLREILYNLDKEFIHQRVENTLNNSSSTARIKPKSQPHKKFSIVPLTWSMVEIELEKVRPYLNADGGDIELVEIDTKKKEVWVRLTGNCGSCPISTMTLKLGVERHFKQIWPDVTIQQLTTTQINSNTSEILEKDVISILNDIESGLMQMGIELKLQDTSDGIITFNSRGIKHERIRDSIRATFFERLPVTLRRIDFIDSG